MSVEIYLSLGTNMGDRLFFLQEALRLLGESKNIQIAKASSIYETEPVGYTDQPAFLNMVIHGQTSLSPEHLLETTQLVEQTLGRKREIRWGPRTIDIDILLYNNREIKMDHLTIPHPRMNERAFVMIPLAEIAPDLIVPGEVAKVAETVALFKGKGVQKWRNKF
ncbi:2-amino-4-hydroxy-6-hydroxymethyldihydropteridine diphosphokinase [Caldalkalibacillus mannanilyticus]|uniref:2-amino-4-hydroxy-6- hydroxymethyldihydropteridine diphosphokinase n=1 Tax=Caldalkalibacillus mannanilyticus TaxID=1418 RepID=UPI0005582373|nr:2-amino-4-hydroxy-6-hydroxymethyldihydropteridine diphosphokinase [Caldalkalibacillus mannanilyticus]